MLYCYSIAGPLQGEKRKSFGKPLPQKLQKQKTLLTPPKKQTETHRSVPPSARERTNTVMPSKLKDEKLDCLFRGILTLETVEDCYSFFEDLCTVSELQEMSRRMQAARMLRNNCVYTDIATRTGLSTATISRVNRCLKYGNDGYNKVLDRLDAAEPSGDGTDRS